MYQAREGHARRHILVDQVSLGKAMGNPHRSHGRRKSRWSEEKTMKMVLTKSRRETSSSGLWDMYRVSCARDISIIYYGSRRGCGFSGQLASGASAGKGASRCSCGFRVQRREAQRRVRNASRQRCECRHGDGAAQPRSCGARTEARWRSGAAACAAFRGLLHITRSFLGDLLSL